MKIKFLWLKFVLTFMGFNVVAVRCVDSSRKVLSYTLNNDYNTQSGSCINYPFLSISIDQNGLYSTQIYQDTPIFDNKVYTNKSPYPLIKLWLKSQHHYRSTRNNKFKWSIFN
jgi:hypothetical protein